eukprot:2172244-Amphidinium_carterae.1
MRTRTALTDLDSSLVVGNCSPQTTDLFSAGRWDLMPGRLACYSSIAGGPRPVLEVDICRFPFAVFALQRSTTTASSSFSPDVPMYCDKPYGFTRQSSCISTRSFHDHSRAPRASL